MPLPVASVRASRAPRGWALLPWAWLTAAAAIVAHRTAIDTGLADALFAWEASAGPCATPAELAA